MEEIIMGVMKDISMELEKLKNDLFMLQMCDHWSSDDYRYADELRERIRELESEVSGNE